MKLHAMTLLGLVVFSSACADAKSTNKQVAALWYAAFDKHDPSILNKALSEDWDGTPDGRERAKGLLGQLTTIFPDFQIKIDDSIQEGDKVVVRATMSGTQAKTFRTFPSKGRKFKIQTIDIHELKNGRIVKTWHSEDWMTGLQQLGVFEK